MSMQQFIPFICLNFQALPLVLQVGKLSKEEIDKILALLVYEKNHIENKREYEELIHNLLLYIEKEGRHL